MTTYQNEHVVVSVQPTIKLLSLTWLGLPTSENYQNGWLAALQFARQYTVKKWLIDQSLLKRFTIEDLQWNVKHYLPQAIQQLGGVGKVAVVLSGKNQFQKLGADLMLKAARILDPYGESKYFKEKEEARKWLIENWETYSALAAATSCIF